MSSPVGIRKAPTGIYGLDEVTSGGLPRGRTTLVCGGPGCGKTLFAAQFLIRGATEYDEPGVFMTFEETNEELTQNVASLGFDLQDLIKGDLVALDHVRIERSEISETGDYDLEGLFVRLSFAIQQVGAKRVVLDTIEALFAGLSNEMILRAELRRLFRWLNDRGITAIVTAERGSGALTRHGLEEYVSDCVILLDHRVSNQISTRRMRIVKYRGTSHGTNEYPFLIDEDGISVLPITSLGLTHDVSSEQISTGIETLDAMFTGGGVYRGSSVLLSGTAGTGKTSISAHIANAACARGERCLYVAFEESPRQLARNMLSIGLQLARWQDEGLLHIHARRPQLYGLEMHLLAIQKLVETVMPSVVVIDPVTNLMSVGTIDEAGAALTRMIDFLKERQITAVFTSLTSSRIEQEKTDVGVSSLMDTWLLLRALESDGERNRALFVLKSRGMAHSNQVREMKITKQGVNLVDVYLGTDGVLTGAARVVQESRDKAASVRREQDLERRRKELDRMQMVLDARVAALKAEFETKRSELQELIRQDEALNELYSDTRAMTAKLRLGSESPPARDTGTNGPDPSHSDGAAHE